jgi:predicted Ser/Thr protein kinase
MEEADITEEFQRGWDAALLAARQWHEAKAKRCLVMARRDRFPKNLEREAELHEKAAEGIAALNPHDV